MPDEEQCCKKSMLESFVDSAKKVIANPTVASAELQQARMDTCHACDRFNGFTCMECGCIMAIKTRMVAVECPLGKWAG